MAHYSCKVDIAALLNFVDGEIELSLSRARADGKAGLQSVCRISLR